MEKTMRKHLKKIENYKKKYLIKRMNAENLKKVKKY